LFDAPQAVEPARRAELDALSSRRHPNITARRTGKKRRVFAAAPEDFSSSKNTGATFFGVRAP
jgi:hypothetical protein